ncbi:fibroblast growth factor binding protein 2a [Cololabis saira]|uniref:fibroblast growth factor binding protein 2a n=1 Tax=Cololabis saira TaxID=129043 RepID=UPI002AD4A362|nr:fibroblast growth factor binding protein 2a [Cololabis saira]
MWIQALLLVCCFWPAETQRDGSRGQNIWENPVKFATRAGDLCTMIITGQGEHTKLRVSCQGGERSYWCDYLGKPHTCSAYNKMPRHYFVQIMWSLRKLQNACEGPRRIKPHMCRKAPDESLMIFSSDSLSDSEPETLPKKVPRPPNRPRRPQNRPGPAPTRSDSARQAAVKSMHIPQGVTTTLRPTPQATIPPVKSYAKRVSQQYCWRSLQGLCSYFIGLFRN